LRLEAHDFLTCVAVAQANFDAHRERYGEQHQARPQRPGWRCYVVELEFSAPRYGIPAFQ
jgi:hypothetical protein